ncbi:hypothetical protein JOC85_002905 [Bacillus mesophilus]|uniref:Uncharacterized protein n=1 Tax=Bacillus mesophilus TaxID=1808955 RepID=A0A6M0QBX8_9BACI|nr:hypothetical protein [Bacillus mesophilus]MBM7662098.1 hypothetical protein [Bacillus mesophilus]NEY72548.1 hypothetical protein [Bacillus mesophilus]
MFTFRGDAHKFFLKIKSSQQEQQTQIKEINELTSIIKFYQTLDRSLLHKIKYQMMKEQQASGSIPLLVTTVPWLLFIFSKPLLNLLFGNFNLWVPFVLIYVSLLLLGIYLHFHERAWAKVHIEIIEDILSERAN